MRATCFTLCPVESGTARLPWSCRTRLPCTVRASYPTPRHLPLRCGRPSICTCVRALFVDLYSMTTLQITHEDVGRIADTLINYSSAVAVLADGAHIVLQHMLCITRPQAPSTSATTLWPARCHICCDWVRPMTSLRFTPITVRAGPAAGSAVGYVCCQLSPSICTVALLRMFT